MAKSVLLTVSGTIPLDIHHQISSGLRPRVDYLELAHGMDADLLDYSAAQKVTGRAGKILKVIGGPNLLLAYACWLLRNRYKAIVTDGEQVGLPLAALLKVSPGRRPRHLMIVHVLSVPKKKVLIDWMGLHDQIDRFLVYSTFQKQFIEQRWKIAPHRVIWTPFMVDDKFFAPESVEPNPTTRPQICAVGLERRDYPTLLQAVQGMNVQVVIAAASPWSKYKDSTSDQHIPENVIVRKFSQYELRQLYADSRFLVMPLENTDFQAGVTALLEAMAMRKAIICSQVPGQTDVVIEGENGLYVAAGDVSDLSNEIKHLLEEPEKAASLGTQGRRLIEREMNLDHYVNRLTDIVRGTIDEPGDRTTV